MLWALHAEEASPGPDALKEAQHQCLFPVQPYPPPSGPPLEGPAPLSVSQTRIMHTQPPTDSWGDRNALHSPVQPLLRASTGDGVGQFIEHLIPLLEGMPETLKKPCCPAPLFQKKEELRGISMGGPHEPGQPRDPDQALPPSQVCPAIGPWWDYSAGQVILEGKGEVSVSMDS